MEMAIALMAKRPEPGRVKTRLATVIGAEAAAAFALAALRDSAARAIRLAAAFGAQPVLLHAPAGAGAAMAGVLPPPSVRTKGISTSSTSRPARCTASQPRMDQEE